MKRRTCYYSYLASSSLICFLILSKHCSGVSANTRLLFTMAYGFTRHNPQNDKQSFTNTATSGNSSSRMDSISNEVIAFASQTSTMTIPSRSLLFLMYLELYIPWRMTPFSNY